MKEKSIVCPKQPRHHLSNIGHGESKMRGQIWFKKIVFAQVIGNNGKKTFSPGNGPHLSKRVSSRGFASFFLLLLVGGYSLFLLPDWPWCCCSCCVFRLFSSRKKRDSVVDIKWWWWENDSCRISLVCLLLPSSFGNHRWQVVGWEL